MRVRFPLLLACLVLAGCPAPTPQTVTTEFFVDSDVTTGSHNGQAANPACSYYQIAAAVVATANAGQDAVVHFSAREAASDIDDKYTGNSSSECNNGGGSASRIDGTLLHKTGTGRIIFDGHFYNTSDTAPVWMPYTGASKPIVYSIFAQNGGHLKINDITIDGLRLIAQSEKAISICGDNWIVRNNDIYAAAGSVNGPLFLIVPTADSAHEGSGEWCPASTNILIEDNLIHDSMSELLYVGGAGCMNADPTGAEPNCGGFPGHSKITIRNNKLYNGGIYGGEGDAIDLKAGIVGVTITGNEIHHIQQGARPIVTQGQNATGPQQQYLIDGNKIHDCAPQDAAIVGADSWGTPNGMTVTNNNIKNCGATVQFYAGKNIVQANNGPDAAVAADAPPLPGGLGEIGVSSFNETTLYLSWFLASDDHNGLKYEVRRSAMDNMRTVLSAETNGTVVRDYTEELASVKITGIEQANVPYFTVIVKDSAGNKAVYKTVRAIYQWH